VSVGDVLIRSTWLPDEIRNCIEAVKIGIHVGPSSGTLVSPHLMIEVQTLKDKTPAGPSGSTTAYKGTGRSARSMMAGANDAGWGWKVASDGEENGGGLRDAKSGTFAFRRRGEATGGELELEGR